MINVSARNFICAFAAILAIAVASYAAPAFADAEFSGRFEANASDVHLFNLPAGSHARVELDVAEGNVSFALDYRRLNQPDTQWNYVNGFESISGKSALGLAASEDLEARIRVSGRRSAYSGVIVMTDIGDIEPRRDADYSAAPLGRPISGALYARSAPAEDHNDIYLLPKLPAGATIRATLEQVKAFQNNGDPWARGALKAALYRVENGNWISLPETSANPTVFKAPVEGAPAEIVMKTSQAGAHYLMVSIDYGTNYRYRLTINIDSEERDKTEGVLQFVSSEGTPISEIRRLEPARLLLTTDGENAPLVEAVNIPGTEERVSLARVDASEPGPGVFPMLSRALDELDENKNAVYVSDWLRIAYPSDIDKEQRSEDGEDNLRLEIYDEEKSRSAVRELFAGRWAVTQTTRAGNDPLADPTIGEAVVSADGASAALAIGTGDKAKKYRAIQIKGNRDATGGGGHVLTIRFERDAQTSSRPAISRTLVAPEDAETLTLTWGEKTRADIRLRKPDPSASQDRIRVTLMKRDAKRLAGGWDREVDGDRVAGGQQTWSQGGRIAGVVVLEDQLGATMASLDGAPSTLRYPYTDDPQNDGGRTRTLLVYGEGLPTSAGDAVAFSSSDPTISYTGRPISPESFQAPRYKKARAAAKIEDPDQYSAMLVEASLARGATSGVKTLSINGMSGNWPLMFSDQTARWSFVRGDPADPIPLTPSTQLYIGEAAHLELFLNQPIPLKSIDAKLFLGPESKLQDQNLGVIALKPTAENPKRFLSEPIHIVSPHHKALKHADNPEALVVSIDRVGLSLSAANMQPIKAITAPRFAVAKLRAPPADDGPWIDALKRVAKCNSEDFDDPTEYAGEPAANITKELLGLVELGGFEFRKGDHAAALLIRDELRIQLGGARSFFWRMSRDLEKAKNFRRAAMENAALGEDPFWTLMKGVDKRKRTFGRFGSFGTVTTEMPLKHTFDHDWLREKLDADARGFDVAGWADLQTQLAAKRQADAISRTQSWMDAVGDCDLSKLLVVSGRDTDRVLRPIRSRLMRRRVFDDEPPRIVWERDVVAQSFVEALGEKGAAVRSLEKYEDAASLVASAVVGVSAFLIVSAISLGSASPAAAAALYATVGIEAADALYFGNKAIGDYYKNEEIAQVMSGAHPIVGRQAFEEAAANRKSPVWTAVEVIAPGLGTAADAQKLFRMKSIQSGRNILRTDPKSLTDLSKLDDAAREDLAAYYAHMASKAETKGAKALSAAEQSDFDRFSEHFAASKKLDDAATDAAPGAAARTPPTGDGPENIFEDSIDDIFAKAGQPRAPPGLGAANTTAKPAAANPPPSAASATDELSRVADDWIEPSAARSGSSTAKTDSPSAGGRAAGDDVAAGKTAKLDHPDSPPPVRATADNLSRPLDDWVDPAASVKSPASTAKSAPPETAGRPASTDALAAANKTAKLDPFDPPPASSAVDDATDANRTAKLDPPDLPPANPLRSDPPRRPPPGFDTNAGTNVERGVSAGRNPGAPAPTSGASAPPQRGSQPTIAMEIDEATGDILLARSDGVTLRLAPQPLAEGGTTSVYLARKPNGELRRDIVVKLTKGGKGDAELNHMGRQVLAAIDDPSVVRAPRATAPIPIDFGGELPSAVEFSGFRDFEGGSLTIAERADVPAFNEAPYRAADGGMTPGQAEAFDRGMRAINDRGYAWLDNKHDNYGFLRTGPGDDWALTILDTGGMVPMRATANASAAKNARALQEAIDKPRDEFRRWFENTGDLQFRFLTRDRLADEFDALVDWRALNDDAGVKFDTLQFGHSELTFPFHSINGLYYPKTGELAGIEKATVEQAYEALRTKYADTLP